MPRVPDSSSTGALLSDANTMDVDVDASREVDSSQAVNSSTSTDFDDRAPVPFRSDNAQNWLPAWERPGSRANKVKALIVSVGSAVDQHKDLHAAKAFVEGSKLNLLLVFCPLGVVARSIGFGSTMTFFVNFLVRTPNTSSAN